jgi:hypothetical protein
MLHMPWKERNLLSAAKPFVFWFFGHGCPLLEDERNRRFGN